MKKCVIIGAGTYGQVYVKYLSEVYDVQGFFDSDINLAGKYVCGFPIIDCVSRIHEYMDNHPDTCIFVPLGNNRRRVELLKEFEGLGYQLPSFIHDTVYLSENVYIGKSVYILPSTNIMPYTKVGDYTMISMGVNIAHHVNIKQGCFFSQGCNIGASISIEEKAYFGMAVAVMTGVKKIGSNCLLGVGTVIIRNVAENSVMVGNPGKLLRYKEPSKKIENFKV